MEFDGVSTAICLFPGCIVGAYLLTGLVTSNGLKGTKPGLGRPTSTTNMARRGSRRTVRNRSARFSASISRRNKFLIARSASIVNYVIHGHSLRNEKSQPLCRKTIKVRRTESSSLSRISVVEQLLHTSLRMISTLTWGSTALHTPRGRNSEDPITSNGLTHRNSRNWGRYT